MKKTRLLYCCVTILLVLSVRANAAGVSISPAEITIQNLVIGQSYNLDELGGMRWEAQNKHEEESHLYFSSMKPVGKHKGFEPIPDASWMQPTDPVFKNIGPWKKESTSVVLTIPNDESLLGKKFYVTLEARVTPPKSAVSIGVSANARILFTISDQPPDESTPAQTQKAKSGSAITTSPFIIDAGKIKKGSVTAVTEKLKITNPSDSAVEVRLDQVSLQLSKLTNVPKVNSLPDGSFLVIENRNIKLPADSTVEIPVYVAIPDSGAYKPGAYAVVINTKVVNTDVSVGTYAVLKFTIE